MVTQEMPTTLSELLQQEATWDEEHVEEPEGWVAAALVWVAPALLLGAPALVIVAATELLLDFSLSPPSLGAAVATMARVRAVMIDEKCILMDWIEDLGLLNCW